MLHCYVCTNIIFSWATNTDYHQILSVTPLLNMYDPKTVSECASKCPLLEGSKLEMLPPDLL